MTLPFSRTRIGRRGSMRRARAAALRPAATPPMTTSAIGALFLFLLHLLHKIQNIEGLDFAVGIITADGVLLVREDLEHSSELGHHEQLDISPVEVHQLDVAAELAQAGRADHQRAKAGAVDEVYARELEHEVALALGSE